MRWILVLLLLLAVGCRRGHYCYDARTGGSIFSLRRGGGAYKACNHACVKKDYVRQWDADHPNRPFRCMCSKACPCWERHPDELKGDNP